jgi:hypothetical protein
MLTAYHCVENAVSIRVTLDGRVHKEPISARTVLAIPHMDVAVIQLDIQKGAPVHLKKGESKNLSLGQQVRAVGFANGDIHLSATKGIVSGRTTKFVQIDASINGGNSGGPLLDADGRVVGIISASLENAENTNFACPIDDFMRYMHLLQGEAPPLSSVYVRRPSIGWTLSKIPHRLLSSISDTIRSGIEVSHVGEGSTVGRAGVCRGDIVLSVDGQAVDTYGRARFDFWNAYPLPLSTLEYVKQVGEKVHISYYSAKEKKIFEKEVDLFESVDSYRRVYYEFEPPSLHLQGGLTVMSLNHNHMEVKAIRKAFSHMMDCPRLFRNSVLWITKVHPESPFNLLGNVGKGQIPTHVNEVRVRTIEEYAEAWKEALSTGNVKLRMRDGTLLYAQREEVEECDRLIGSKITFAQ